MPLLPFHVLGVWFRGLLTVALIAAGVFLLREWYVRREVVVLDPPPPPTAEVPDPPPPGPRVVRWEFGPNRETAFLLGGTGLLLFSFGGGLLPSVLLRRPGGGPGEVTPASTARVRRPDGTHVHVEFHGPADAPPVVLTHGWGLNRKEWNYLVRELSGRHRLVVWDLPGLGKSERPADGSVTMEGMAADLRAVLALAGGPAVLAGHSIGGMITLTFCRLFPESLGAEVRGLALVHTTYTNPAKTASMAWLYTALQKPVLEPMFYLTIALAPVVQAMNWLDYLNGSAHRATERTGFSGRESRGQLDFMAQFYVAAWPATVARGFLAMGGYDATGVLGGIPVPTLVVAADGDTCCTPEASRFMAVRIPGSRLETLANARHCGLFEHHAEFARLLGGFAAACPVPAGAGVAG